MEQRAVQKDIKLVAALSAGIPFMPGQLQQVQLQPAHAAGEPGPAGRNEIALHAWKHARKQLLRADRKGSSAECKGAQGRECKAAQ